MVKVPDRIQTEDIMEILNVSSPTTSKENLEYHCPNKCNIGLSHGIPLNSDESVSPLGK